jgi:predicted nucleic acid-binding protein
MTRIYIDTNVFLDFYQSATDRMAVFQQLFERVDCIILPEQTVKEFRRNRAANGILETICEHRLKLLEMFTREKIGMMLRSN